MTTMLTKELFLEKGASIFQAKREQVDIGNGYSVYVCEMNLGAIIALQESGLFQEIQKESTEGGDKDRLGKLFFDLEMILVEKCCVDSCGKPIFDKESVSVIPPTMFRKLADKARDVNSVFFTDGAIESAEGNLESAES